MRSAGADGIVAVVVETAAEVSPASRSLSDQATRVLQVPGPTPLGLRIAEQDRFYCNADRIHSKEVHHADSLADAYRRFHNRLVLTGVTV